MVECLKSKSSSLRNSSWSAVSLTLALPILLNHFFQIVGHFRQRFQSHFHAAIIGPSDDGIYFCEAYVFLGIIVAKLRAATLFSLQSCTRDRLRNREQIFQIKSRMPAGIEIAVACDADMLGPFPKGFQVIER